MTTLLALAPQHTFPHAAALLYEILTHALEWDSRNITDISMALAMTMDADHGRTAIRHVTSYNELDSLLCFGATYKSTGLDSETRKNEFNTVRFSEQLKPVKVTCLPPVLDRIWTDERYIVRAAQALKVLLEPRDGDVDLLQPTTVFAIDKRTLN